MLVGSAKWVEGVATENKKFKRKREANRLMCSKVDVRLALNESTFPFEPLCPLTWLFPLPRPSGQPSATLPPRLPPFRLWLINFIFSKSGDTTAHIEVGIFDSGTGHDEKAVDIGTACPREGDALASDLARTALKVGIGEAAVDEAV